MARIKAPPAFVFYEVKLALRSAGRFESLLQPLPDLLPFTSSRPNLVNGSLRLNRRTSFGRFARSPLRWSRFECRVVSSLVFHLWLQIVIVGVARSVVLR